MHMVAVDHIDIFLPQDVYDRLRKDYHQLNI